MGEIEESLDVCGLTRHERVDSVRWAALMEKAFSQRNFLQKDAERISSLQSDLAAGTSPESDFPQDERPFFQPLRSLPEGGERPWVRVYQTKFHKDRKLSSHIIFPEYYVPLQVGAALTDIRAADLSDDTGDNISAQNGNYSELTGLYWLWKNVVEKDPEAENHYYGLAHYRRFLDLDEAGLRRLAANDVDATLPYPMPYEPDMEAHHRRYLSDVDWAHVCTALQELQPDYAAVLPEILKGQWMYNYNIILAKGTELSRYCAWLFPLLKRVDSLSNPDGTRADRYLGYAAETLNTVYHLYCENRKRLRIAHAGCRFLT